MGGGLVEVEMETKIELCEVMRYPSWFLFTPYNQHVFMMREVKNPKSTVWIAPKAGFDLDFDEKTLEIIVYAKVGDNCDRGNDGR